MKKHFFGIYYKHQSKDGYTIAVIVSTSNEGDMVQIIDNDKSYQIKDIKSVDVSFQGINFDVHQHDIEITGHLQYGQLTKPKKDVMSYYRYLPIECKHQIYSMNHSLSGSLIINGKTINFDGGDGYMEGDKGRNFPKQYLWFNASSKEVAITLAVATIPLGLIKIMGTTSLIVHNNKEYRFGTYNFARAKIIEKDHILIKKGKYKLEIFIDDHDGHALKAPVKGDMIRTIHECPSVKARCVLSKNNKTIFDITHPYSSFEFVF